MSNPTLDYLNVFFNVLNEAVVDNEAQILAANTPDGHEELIAKLKTLASVEKVIRGLRNFKQDIYSLSMEKLQEKYGD